MCSAGKKNLFVNKVGSGTTEFIYSIYEFSYNSLNLIIIRTRMPLINNSSDFRSQNSDKLKRENFVNKVILMPSGSYFCHTARDLFETTKMGPLLPADTSRGFARIRGRL